MAKKQEPTYQELKTELDELLEQLQADDISVEDAMKHYERGMELIAELGKHLTTAENKITKLKAKFDT
jgi:exodeoxyribonuclease VII small subunit